MARRPLNAEPVSKLAAWSSRLAVFARDVAALTPPSPERHTGAWPGTSRTHAIHLSPARRTPPPSLAERSTHLAGRPTVRQKSRLRGAGPAWPPRFFISPPPPFPPPPPWPRISPSAQTLTHRPSRATRRALGRGKRRGTAPRADPPPPCNAPPARGWAFGRWIAHLFTQAGRTFEGTGGRHRRLEKLGEGATGIVMRQSAFGRQAARPPSPPF